MGNQQIKSDSGMPIHTKMRLAHTHMCKIIGKAEKKTHKTCVHVLYQQRNKLLNTDFTKVFIA